LRYPPVRTVWPMMPKAAEGGEQRNPVDQHRRDSAWQFVLFWHGGTAVGRHAAAQRFNAPCRVRSRDESSAWRYACAWGMRGVVGEREAKAPRLPCACAVRCARAAACAARGKVASAAGTRVLVAVCGACVRAGVRVRGCVMPCACACMCACGVRA